MDGLGIRALTKEWNQWFAGARIDKIHQPNAREIVLVLRTAKATERVLLSAHRQLSRAHILRDIRPTNPQEPPMFCMLLRRRMEGGRIARVWQPGYERVLCLEIDALTDIGDPAKYVLVLEVMGKHSNLIFCVADESGNPGRIVDAIVHVTPDMSRVRPILPGTSYSPPPPQDKNTIDTLSPETLKDALEEAGTPKQQERAVMSVLQGIGPDTAREALYRWKQSSSDDSAILLKTLQQLFEDTLAGREAASVLEDELGQAIAAAPFSFQQGRSEEMDSFDAAVERLYGTAVTRSQFSAEFQSLTGVVKETIDRLRGKRTKLRAQQVESQDVDTPRIAGELLMTYGYQIAKGLSSVTLPNFYNNEEPMEIALDPSQTATQNATQYFKVASKRKRAIPLLAEELEKTEQDLAYLDSVLANLEYAQPVHYASIRHELERQGFVSQAKNKRTTGQHGKHGQKGVRKARPSDDIGKPDEFMSSDGLRIRVGRNNLQNDRLTLRQSRPDDVWLHVKDAPGSHVIIEADRHEVPETTLHEAALLAAFYSRLRTSTNVPVDYTQVKHVWKPNGARPGYVLYDHQRTLYATPDRALIEELTRRNRKDQS